MFSKMSITFYILLVVASISSTIAFSTKINFTSTLVDNRQLDKAEPVVLLKAIRQQSNPNVNCVSQRQSVRLSIRRGYRSNPRLIAGVLRAFFHDCITAVPSRRDSGCNGSIRLAAEINAPDNRRLAFVVSFITPLVDGTCVSFADALQIGVEQALTLFGGGQAVRGRLQRGITDATRAERVQGEIPNTLSSIGELKRFYARKGFSVRELVVSNVGGHAVGRFLDQRDGVVKPFTPTESRFNNDYAVNLVQKKDTNNNLPGFNTLPSDDAQIPDAETFRWLEFYAGKQGNNMNRALGNNRLRRDFANFLIKLSRK